MVFKVIGTGSRGNAYILESSSEALLIECGVNISEIKKALDFSLEKVVGCLVTHEHNDHSKSMADVMSLGIDLYATEHTLKAKGQEMNIRAIAIKPKRPFVVGQFKILPFDVKHDVPCVGFLIEHKECGRTLFITDTYYCKYTFVNLNNIIIEANYSKKIIDQKFGPDSGKEFLRNRILKSHFSLENCKDMLSVNDLSKVNNIVLIHLSDSNSDEKMFVQEVKDLTGKNVCAAFNGMTIGFNKTPF